jgi:microcystin-dependent protein
MSGYNVQNPSTFVVQPVPLSPDWLPGMMMPYAGPVAPTNWLLCNGQSLLRSQYLALFEIIGTTYGSVDSEHFNLPDCRGNVIVGKGSQTYCNTLGELGGEQTHTLTTGEMPSHNHTGTTDSAGSHTHTLNNATTVQKTGNNTPSGLDSSANEIDNVNVLTSTVNANGAHVHTFTTGNTGGGAAHNNLQPYITLNYIIRYASK